MKFSDIPKLHRAHYRVDVPLDGLIYHLDRWEKTQERFGYKLYMNPEFQRGHVWTQRQQIAYLQWLLMGGESGRDVYFNHPRWTSDYEADMYCVDGLQRLTAVRAFMENRLPVFGTYLNDFEGGSGYLYTISLTFNVASLSYANMLRWYLQLNSGGTVHTQEELDKVRQMIREL